MKKFLVLFIILFSSNVLAHMDHYKKYNKIDMDIYRNGKLIGYHSFSFKKNGNNLSVKSYIKFEIKKFGVKKQRWALCTGIRTFKNEFLVFGLVENELGPLG